MNNMNFEALDAHTLSLFNQPSPYGNLFSFNDDLGDNYFPISTSELDDVFTS